MSGPYITHRLEIGFSLRSDSFVLSRSCSLAFYPLLETTPLRDGIEKLDHGLGLHDTDEIRAGGAAQSANGNRRSHAAIEQHPDRRKGRQLGREEGRYR